MSNIITIDIPTDKALPIARKYYMRTCGLDEGQGSSKHARMLQRSISILGEVLPTVSMKAVIGEYPGSCLQDTKLVLDGVEFECSAFARLDPERIRGIYPYVVTAGEVRIDNGNISDILFGDIWGTAFAEAGRDLVRHIIASQNSDITVSSSFGPGFYGMDITMVGQFFELLKPETIGMELKNTSLMLPLKSCAGFFVVTEDEWSLPTRDCASCLGNTKSGGCRFCASYLRSIAERK